MVSKVFNAELRELEPVVIDSMGRVFSSMFGTNPKLLRSVEGERLPNDQMNIREISGIIGFIQEENLEGTMSLGLSYGPVTTLMSRFYGEKLDRLDDPKIFGGVGELTNMVHGVVKHKLNELGYDFHMNLPLVVIGKNHSFFSSVSGKSYSFEFELEAGKILVEIFIHKKQ